jgi:hypothetical protein
MTQVRLESAKRGEGTAIVQTYSRVFINDKEYSDTEIFFHEKDGNKYHLVATSMSEEPDEKGHYYVLKNEVFLKELCRADAASWKRWL